MAAGALGKLWKIAIAATKPAESHCGNRRFRLVSHGRADTGGSLPEIASIVENN
jgi:hypothetical protein